MQAEKEAETSRIRMQQLLQEREAEQQRDMIQNEMYLGKQKAFADAEHYRCCTVLLWGCSAHKHSSLTITMRQITTCDSYKDKDRKV